MYDDLIFLDFEVFRHDWLVVFKNMKGITKVIHNDPTKLKKFWYVYKDRIFVGYNIRHYDQYIFKAILKDINPYLVSQYIISGKNGWEYSEDFIKIQLHAFDIMTTEHSLKQLEGFMGNSIVESSVSFDLDRKLTKEELFEVIKYCYHDVDQTIEVFKNRTSEFDAQLGLIEMFDLDMSNFSKTKVQLSAKILKAKKTSRKDEFKLNLPKFPYIKKYREVLEWYLNPENHKYEKPKYKKNGEKCKNDQKNQLEINICGLPHVLGYGGIHSANENLKEEGIILNMDIALI